MIEYLYKDKIHYFFTRYCYIKFFNLTADNEYGTNVYIIYYSFATKSDECFTWFLDDDIEDLHDICIRRVVDEVSHRI